MRSRRGEVPFVASRVGRSNDPREVLGLARELKTSRAEALGFVTLWEEFILEVGDALTGRVKGYGAVHVAAKLGYEGNPRKLLEALKHAGVLAQQKTSFFHPYWRQSITGTYASDRAEQREHWRLKKAQQRLEDVPAMSPGHTGDNRGTSQGTADIDKERNDGAGADAPPSPPGAGGGPGKLRWEWMLEHHERPRNPDACVRILDSMSAADWALVEWVCDRIASGAPLSSLGKKRVAKLDTHRFLATSAFLEFRRERASILAPKTRKTPAPAHDPVADAAERTAKAATFVLEQLADTTDEHARAKIRERWMKAHPEGTPPWEDWDAVAAGPS